MDLEEGSNLGNKLCIFSVLSLIFAIIFPILGIVFGIIALDKIKQDSNLRGKVLAIIGIILSIIIFLSILFFLYLILMFKQHIANSKNETMSCDIGSPLICKDVTIFYGTKMTIAMLGSGEKRINLTRIQVDDCNEPTEQMTASKNELAMAFLDCKKLTNDENFERNIVIDYSYEGSSEKKQLTGRIYGRAVING